MRWRGGRQSSNVEDYRGRPGFGGGGLKLGIGGLVAVAAAYFFGIDPRVVLGLLDATSGGGPASVQQPETSLPQDEMGQFVSVVLADTEDTWTALLKARGLAYEPPRLRLFTGATQSGCGAAGAEMGPFYCPVDHRVYLDVGFYQELEQRFDAPGDFARAYVLAHEVGHHVQNLLGTSEQVRAAEQRAGSGAQANQLSVRLELQADCYAGIWAHHAQRSRQILEQGDLEEALGAAAAVGDDMLQKRTQGRVVPESFTHGTAAQRQHWFERGFDSGTLEACDTFNSRSL